MAPDQATIRVKRRQSLPDMWMATNGVCNHVKCVTTVSGVRYFHVKGKTRLVIITLMPLGSGASLSGSGQDSKDLCRWSMASQVAFFTAR